MLTKFTAPNFDDYVTPDENPAGLVELYSALVEDLSPSNHLERRQVELIAHCDWEISRHRRQSAKLLSATVGDLLHHDHTSRRLYDPSFFDHETQNEYEGDDETDTNEDDVEEAGREEPQPSSELVSKAYVRDIDVHAHHQKSADRLEAQRRQLLRDLEDIKRMRSRGAIEDAEVRD